MLFAFESKTVINIENKKGEKGHPCEMPASWPQLLRTASLNTCTETFVRVNLTDEWISIWHARNR